MLGEISWLTWKSRKQKAKEEAEYRQWAFPYGEPQREKVTALLSVLFPHEKPPIALIAFLTYKELFYDAQVPGAPYDEAIRITKKFAKKYRHMAKKEFIPTYLALVVADYEIDSELNYPTAEEIRENAKKYE
jgi:hypothetical protein